MGQASHIWTGSGRKVEAAVRAARNEQDSRWRELRREDHRATTPTNQPPFRRQPWARFDESADHRVPASVCELCRVAPLHPFATVAARLRRSQTTSPPDYVAAFAPDAGESLAQISEAYPAEAGADVAPDFDGYLWIAQDKFRQSFCQDLPEDEALVMAVTQKAPVGSTFGDTVTDPAWKTKPSWYQVSSQDPMIHPDNERRMATRLGTRRTVELDASHASLASQPVAVAISSRTQPIRLGSQTGGYRRGCGTASNPRSLPRRDARAHRAR